MSFVARSEDPRGPNGEKVHFRHYLMRNGQRVTLSFILAESGDNGKLFRVGYARYNPKHESGVYTKKKARDLAFTRLMTNSRVGCFDITVPADGERTYATYLINGLVDQDVLPRMFSADGPRDVKRFQDYSWDTERGMVRKYTTPQ